MNCPLDYYEESLFIPSKLIPSPIKKAPSMKLETTNRSDHPFIA
jgi:hypothetical protein